MKLIRYVVILIDRLSWILTCLDKIGSLSSSTLLRHPTDVPIKNKINKIVLFNISNHFSWLDLTKPELNFNDRRLNFRTDTLAHLFRVMWLRWTLKKTLGRNEQLERMKFQQTKFFQSWRNLFIGATTAWQPVPSTHLPVQSFLRFLSKNLRTSFGLGFWNSELS